MNVHYLAAIDATDVQNFWERVQENIWRSSLSLVFGLAVAVAMAFASKKWVRFLAIIAAPGTAWLVWKIYNFASGNTTPLFVNENTGEFWKIFSLEGWAAVASVVGLLLAFFVFKATKNQNVFLSQLPAALGTWAGVNLLYGVIARGYAVPQFIIDWVSSWPILN